MKYVLLFENFDSKLSIGDSTNLGIIDDETETQFYINGKWYHKSLVKPSKETIKKEPLRNRGKISPNLIISAFANVI